MRKVDVHQFFVVSLAVTYGLDVRRTGKMPSAIFVILTSLALMVKMAESLKRQINFVNFLKVSGPNKAPTHLTSFLREVNPLYNSIMHL